MSLPAVGERWRHRRGPVLLGILASLLAIIAIYGVNLPSPFHGDQALYQLGGRELGEGRVLYRDFWDHKNPGVYLFNFAAGELFSYSELGVHLTELVYLVLLSLALIVASRPWLRNPSLAFAAPLLTVGMYGAFAGHWHLTQPAILAVAPLFLVAWLPLLPGPARARWLPWFAAGLVGAACMLLKDILLPLVVLLLLAGALTAPGEAPANRQGKWSGFLVAMAGLGFGLGTITVVLWRVGALEFFVWSRLAFLVQAMALHGLRPAGRLVGSGVWFTQYFGILALVALATVLGWRGVRGERFFVMQAVALVGGGLAIVAEPFAWWPFDTLLLCIPLGLLALRGLDGMLWQARQRVPGMALVTAVAATLIMAPAAYAWARKARDVRRWVMGTEDQRRHQLRVSEWYRTVSASTARLRGPASVAGPVYVFGDPLYLYLGERRQAARIHGWGWELYLPSQWRELAEELAVTPPAYIFVDPSYAELIAAKAPDIRQWISATYDVEASNSLGTWFRRRDGGTR